MAFERMGAQLSLGVPAGWSQGCGQEHRSRGPIVFKVLQAYDEASERKALK